MKAMYQQEGKSLDYINSTEDMIEAGTLVIIGAIAGVAATNIAPGEIGSVVTTGVYVMPKDSSDIKMGDKIAYLKDSDQAKKAADEAEAENPFIGIAVQDAGTDAATVAVRLNG